MCSLENQQLSCGKFGVCVEEEPPLFETEVVLEKNINNRTAVSRCICQQGWGQSLEFSFLEESETSLEQLPCDTNDVLLKCLYSVALTLSVGTILFNALQIRRMSQVIRLLPLFLGFSLHITYCLLKLTNLERGYAIDPAFTVIWSLAFLFTNVMGLIFINRYVHYQEKLITRKEMKISGSSYVRYGGDKSKRSPLMAKSVRNSEPWGEQAGSHRTAAFCGSRGLQTFVIFLTLVMVVIFLTAAFYKDDAKISKLLFQIGLGMGCAYSVYGGGSSAVLIANLVNNMKTIIQNSGTVPANSKRATRASSTRRPSTTGLNSSRLWILQRSIPNLWKVMGFASGYNVITFVLYLLPLVDDEYLRLWKYFLPIYLICGNGMTLGILYYFMQIRKLAKKKMKKSPASSYYGNSQFNAV